MEHSVDFGGIRRLTTPLPQRPGSVNAYLAPLDAGGWLLVDGGIDSEAAWAALSTAVTATASWGELKLHVVTHMHLDHIGLASRVRDASSVPLAMGELDAVRAAHAATDPEEEREYRSTLLRSNGAPPDVVAAVAGRSTGARPGRSTFVPADLTLPSGSARLDEAPEWQSVWTPGHTAGHTALFRARDRTLIAGDAVIPRVSPTIGVNRQRVDAVGDYLDTLDRLQGLRPRVVLGGHGEMLEGSERIVELRREVEAEAVRVRDLLSSEPVTAWDLALQRYHGRELPTAVRVQALRETRAHLDRLVASGAALRLTNGGTDRFVAPPS
jgi:glyoxylase-like metal-dependent hydrolase (beta-lactamase superfamily II)